MTDIVERSPAHEALMDYQPADMDGVMVTVSRQAIHEVDDEIERLLADLEKAKADRRESITRDRAATEAYNDIATQYRYVKEANIVLAEERDGLRSDNARLKKRERAAEDILTEIESYFDEYADGDEDGPNREARLMALCAEWLGPVPDTLRPPTAVLEPEGR